MPPARDLLAERQPELVHLFPRLDPDRPRRGRLHRVIHVEQLEPCRDARAGRRVVLRHDAHDRISAVQPDGRFPFVHPLSGGGRGGNKTHQYQQESAHRALPRSIRKDFYVRNFRTFAVSDAPRFSIGCFRGRRFQAVPVSE